MSDLVGNPEDRFSHNEAHLDTVDDRELSYSETFRKETKSSIGNQKERKSLIKRDNKIVELVLKLFVKINLHMELNQIQRFDDMVTEVCNHNEKRLVESVKRRQKFIQRMETLRDRNDVLVERRIQRMRNNGINITVKEFRNRPDVKAIRKASRLDKELGEISIKLTGSSNSFMEADTMDSKESDEDKSDDSELDSDREIVDSELYIQGISAPVVHQKRNAELKTHANARFKPVNTTDAEPSVEVTETGGLIGKESSTEVKKMISRIGRLSLSVLKPSSVKSLSNSEVKNSNIGERARQVGSDSPWNFLMANSGHSSDIGKQALCTSQGVHKVVTPSDYQAQSVPEIIVEEVNHRMSKRECNEPISGGNLKTMSNLKTIGTPKTLISGENTTAETAAEDGERNFEVVEGGVMGNLLHHVLNDPSPENISILKQLISERGDEGVDLSLLEPFMIDPVADVDSKIIGEDDSDNEEETVAVLNKMSKKVKTVSLKEKKQHTRTKTTRSKGHTQSRKVRGTPSGENLTENTECVEAFLIKHAVGDTPAHSRANESLKRAKIKLKVINAISDSK